MPGAARCPSEGDDGLVRSGTSRRTLLGPVLVGLAACALVAAIVFAGAIGPGAGAPPTSPAASPLAAAPTPSTSPSPGAGSAASPIPTSAPTGTPALPRIGRVSEVEIGTAPVGPTACQAAFEPIVATHPSDPNRLAVAYERDVATAGRCAAEPVMAISHDGGRTWQTVLRSPWAGSGRFPDNHATIAWGPGPRPGSARLYWADATVSNGSGNHLLSVAWSDDEGRTWSRLYTERRTPPWVGGFPDITVDRNPASPDYGVVYVAYNWLASATLGPGLRVLASADYGGTWQAVEVPRAPAPAGYPASWRIGYRLRTGPGGSLYVAAYQADLRHWDASAIFSKGGVGNVGRHGFTVARLEFRRSSRHFTLHPTVMALTLPRNAYTVNQLPAPGTTANVYVDPMWQIGLDVDQATGVVFLAAGDYRAQSDPGLARGAVRVGRSLDGGQHWAWVTLPPLPATGGAPASSYRPSIVAAHGQVIVGLHGLTDAPVGTSPGRHLPVVVSAVALSGDDGRTFATPVVVSAASWNAAALETQISGPGLRDRIELTAAGRIVYVYGDGRLARPLPDARAGRAAVFVALVDLDP